MQIIRLLVMAGPEGMAAGALGEKLGAASPKMSFHLSHLEQAGLITSRRDGKSIRYSIQVAALSELIGFLMRDCCQGQPEICGPAMADLIEGATCAPAACGSAA